MTAVAFERRLASFRAARAGALVPDPAALARASSAAAERLAAEVDGELVRTAAGAFVRLDGRGDIVPVDRERLARLPGQPPPEVPLVCLDTETTGLATASGTIAFLVGLGWWQRDRFRQVQLLLPDHAFEPALLDELGRHLPPNAWLVTYNGRTFDWPLLVARYRMARRDAPVHAGHLDLLPFVRRVFRHRLPDARLRTVETCLLGVRRHADVEGWQIPARYFDFLRGGPASPLLEVIRHNDSDVRSLALLVAHLERRLGDARSRAGAPAGDLAGLARGFAREQRLEEALDCLDAAFLRRADEREAGRTAGPDHPREPKPGAGRSAEASLLYGRPFAVPIARRRDWPAVAATASGSVARDPFGRTPLPVSPDRDDLGWLSPRRPADFGGPPAVRSGSPWPAVASLVAGEPWTLERIAVDRARLLRRARRHGDAEAAWRSVAEGGGRSAIHAWIEVAKLREHRLGDPVGALEATLAATALLRRQPLGGRAFAPLDRGLSRRAARLRSRLLAGRDPAWRTVRSAVVAP